MQYMHRQETVLPSSLTFLRYQTEYLGMGRTDGRTEC